MAVRILRDMAQDFDEVKVVFANTGCEHEKTLEYVERISLHYGLPTVWVEAVPQARGTATAHRVVTFETASRKGEPFEAVVAKYGLPNQAYNHCTRETKLAPIRSYLNSVGWEKGSYKTAIGIRVDEVDRVTGDPALIYPLVGWRVTKADVQAWDALNPVRLGIPEHYGNCVWCWKKSFRKLATIARERLVSFDFIERMELQHAFSGAIPDGRPRQVFRNKATVADLVAFASSPCFEPFVDGAPWRDDADTGGSCGDSCELTEM